MSLQTYFGIIKVYLFELTFRTDNSAVLLQQTATLIQINIRLPIILNYFICVQHLQLTLSYFICSLLTYMLDSAVLVLSHPIWCCFLFLELATFLWIQLLVWVRSCLNFVWYLFRCSLFSLSPVRWLMPVIDCCLIDSGDSSCCCDIHWHNVCYYSTWHRFT